MKYGKWIAIAGVCMLIMTGCSKKQTEMSPEVPEADEEITVAAPEPVEEAGETISPEKIPDTGLKEGEMFSYLTGEPIRKEAGTRRPVAVMLNNIKAAVPQYGISKAGVIYEVPVEGGITRLMGIFEDYDALDKLGSVRSCRDYFIFYASGFDAIYTHFGQSVYAEPYLEMEQVNNLSGLAGYGDQVFYRTDDRKPPHNAYTSFEGIQKGIELNGYRTDYKEGFNGTWKFADKNSETELENGAVANRVVPGGYDYNHGYFLYDPEKKVYKRFQYDAEQIDEMTGEQLEVKNILFQYTNWKKYDENGYLNIDVNTPGTGKYITNGKAIDVRWEKQDPWGQTYFYDQGTGEQITLNPGKTWVCVILDTYAEKSEITDSVE